MSKFKNFVVGIAAAATVATGALIPAVNAEAAPRPSSQLVRTVAGVNYRPLNVMAQFTYDANNRTTQASGLAFPEKSRIQIFYGPRTTQREIDYAITHEMMHIVDALGSKAQRQKLYGFMGVSPRDWRKAADGSSIASWQASPQEGLAESWARMHFGRSRMAMRHNIRPKDYAATKAIVNQIIAQSAKANVRNDVCDTIATGQVCAPNVIYHNLPRNTRIFVRSYLVDTKGNLVSQPVIKGMSTGAPSNTMNVGGMYPNGSANNSFDPGLYRMFTVVTDAKTGKIIAKDTSALMAGEMKVVSAK